MTKDIDPLVEKVTAAIKAATKEEVYVHDVKFLHATMDVVRAAQARAAIEAVLAWYSKTENINEDMIREVIINRGVSAHQVVAAAMAAELKRRQ